MYTYLGVGLAGWLAACPAGWMGAAVLHILNVLNVLHVSTVVNRWLAGWMDGGWGLSCLKCVKCV